MAPVSSPWNLVWIGDVYTFLNRPTLKISNIYTIQADKHCPSYPIAISTIFFKYSSYKPKSSKKLKKQQIKKCECVVLLKSSTENAVCRGSLVDLIYCYLMSSLQDLSEGKTGASKEGLTPSKYFNCNNILTNNYKTGKTDLYSIRKSNLWEF